MAEIELTTGGKWLLFLAGIAAILAALGRLVVQPLFAAWVFFTLRTEQAKMRALVDEAIDRSLDEIRTGIREIRKCQEEHGQELADVAGYVRRMGEEGR